eukprot:9683366-Alexandrium_andersonii.AAC.1
MAIAGTLGLERRPWGLRRDGDIWGIICSALQARGAGTTRVQWVPGHMDASHVRQGLVTEAQRRGNARDDELAKRGRLLADWQHEACVWLRGQIARYKAFSRAVQAMALA